jgi:hypothetical protein
MQEMPLKCCLEIEAEYSSSEVNPERPFFKPLGFEE